MSQQKQEFVLGDKVVDRDGFCGAVVKVTNWEGSHWYDVNFGRTGTAVRYESDLTLVEAASGAYARPEKTGGESC